MSPEGAAEAMRMLAEMRAQVARIEATLTGRIDALERLAVSEVFRTEHVTDDAEVARR